MAVRKGGRWLGDEVPRLAYRGLRVNAEATQTAALGEDQRAVYTERVPSPRRPGVFVSGHERHRRPQGAQSSGVDPECYDRTRPPYPGELVEWIIATSPGTEFLDVGTGTGIAARQFQAAGCTVLGVEPDARLASFARRTGVKVEVAPFESWDPAGRQFDAVVAGHAWHFVDPVAGAARAARVLRPGGRLAAFWHLGEPPREVAEAFAAAWHRVVPGSLASFRARPGQAGRNAAAFTITTGGGIRQAGGFSDPEQWRYDWQRTCTRDEWLGELPASGALAPLPPDKLAEVLAGTGAAIDALGGSVTMNYATVAVTAVRISAAWRGRRGGQR